MSSSRSSGASSAQTPSAGEYSLKSYAQSIMPEWSLADWAQWPPDLFALTSLILRVTGAYRFAVNRPDEGVSIAWLDDPEWNRKILTTVKAWQARISPGEGLQNTAAKSAHQEALSSTVSIEDLDVDKGPVEPKLLDECLRILEENWDDVSLDDLAKVVELKKQSGSKQNPVNIVAHALITLHAISDLTCGGVGIPVGGAGSNTMELVSNMLLASTGTLSRIPKHHGVVLPKTRTPQLGLSMRSFSHHVTFHNSEVDVLWRSVPWMNMDENTANILLVPWPDIVRPQWFRPYKKPLTANQHFHYAPDETGFSLKRLMDLYRKAREVSGRIHLIVFPEMALTRKELVDLQEELGREPPAEIPMILAGVRGGNNEVKNCVVLSVYFVNRWYLLEQDKHHRWRLDESQITTYGLAGSLAPVRPWWEAIQVPKRQLHFLVPNGWLSICPLICEDLAQLEPISELIRGVGPTIVLAILMDGPQLTSRWPARYASVLAGDPGTSVLTLTSIGMCERSVPEGETLNRTVGLWRDESKGWRSIEFSESDEAAVLTVSAQWKEEFTADGRSDGGHAALIKYQGLKLIDSRDAPPEPRRRAKPDTKTADATDIFEMSAMTYLVEAALEAHHKRVGRLARWTLARGSKPPEGLLQPELARSIWRKLSETREKLGWPKSNMKFAVECIVKTANKVKGERAEGGTLREKDLKKWSRFQREVRTGLLTTANLPKVNGLTREEVRRVRIAVGSAFLWAIHARLERYRRQGKLDRERKELLAKIERIWERGTRA